MFFLTIFIIGSLTSWAEPAHLKLIIQDPQGMEVIPKEMESETLDSADFTFHDNSLIKPKNIEIRAKAVLCKDDQGQTSDFLLMYAQNTVTHNTSLFGACKDKSANKDFTVSQCVADDSNSIRRCYNDYITDNHLNKPLFEILPEPKRATLSQKKFSLLENIQEKATATKDPKIEILPRHGSSVGSPNAKTEDVKMNLNSSALDAVKGILARSRMHPINSESLSRTSFFAQKRICSGENESTEYAIIYGETKNTAGTDIEETSIIGGCSLKGLDNNLKFMQSADAYQKCARDAAEQNPDFTRCYNEIKERLRNRGEEPISIQKVKPAPLTIDPLEPENEPATIAI